MRLRTLLGILFGIGGIVALPVSTTAQASWMTKTCELLVEEGVFKKHSDCMERITVDADRFCTFMDRISYFVQSEARWKSRAECKEWYDGPHEE